MIRIEVVGRPPSLPRLEVFLDGEDKQEVVNLMPGKELLMAIYGDFALRASVEEYDDFIEKVTERDDFRVEDLRQTGMSLGAVPGTQDDQFVQTGQENRSQLQPMSH